jgi:uncharacterized protein (DUF2141 family)
MRTFFAVIALMLVVGSVLAQSPAAKEYTLTVTVENMDSTEGNLGILIFNGPNGWAEDRKTALKDISIPAQKGVQKVPVQLPEGKYAIALIHDVNVNHKLDKNFIGMPKEYWGMSNNPHATIKAPPIEKAMFTLDGDKEVKITLQK